MKKEYIKSIFDGVLQAVLLRLLIEFIFSIYLLEPIERNLILVSILIIISLTSFIVLVIVNSKKKLWIKSAISCTAFVLLNFISFATLPFRTLPLRETSDADGLLVLLFSSLYVGAIIILRAVLLVVALIMKKRKT